MGALHADVALTLLFGIVEGMGMKEGPNKLAADIFEAKFKVSVLIDSVMAAIEGGGADVEALLVGNFFRLDQVRRVTCASGSNRRIKGMGKGVAESDPRRGSFHSIRSGNAIKHAGLSGHVGN